MKSSCLQGERPLTNGTPRSRKLIVMDPGKRHSSLTTLLTSPRHLFAGVQSGVIFLLTSRHPPRLGKPKLVSTGVGDLHTSHHPVRWPWVNNSQGEVNPTPAAEKSRSPRDRGTEEPTARNGRWAARAVLRDLCPTPRWTVESPGSLRCTKAQQPPAPRSGPSDGPREGVVLKALPKDHGYVDVRTCSTWRSVWGSL